jgi:hypothetical protein
MEEQYTIQNLEAMFNNQNTIEINGETINIYLKIFEFLKANWIALTIATVILLILNGIPLLKLAKEQKIKENWFGFIPIAGFILSLQVAEMSSWFGLTLLLFFIPIVGTFILGPIAFLTLSVVIWMKIAEKNKQPHWLGILNLTGIGMYFVPLIIAYGNK